MPQAPRDEQPPVPTARLAKLTRLARLARLTQRAGLVVFVAVSALSFVATLAWAVLTMRSRPLDGVEGEIIFEAMRLREKSALYIDPVAGDLAGGEPATRYFVLYPPLFSWLVSRIPVSGVAQATVLVRSLSLAAWLSAVLVVARPARRPGARP